MCIRDRPACAVADGPAAESALYARACFVPAGERADLPDFRGGQPNAAVDGALAGRVEELEQPLRDRGPAARRLGGIESSAIGRHARRDEG